jgi:predicted transcriptional regulator
MFSVACITSILRDQTFTGIHQTEIHEMLGEVKRL